MNKLLDFRGTPNLTRGLRNNNPGNLRPMTSGTWDGEVGKDPDGNGGFYSIFSDVYSGVRAEGIVLIHYFQKYGLNTAGLIANRWSPASDHNVPSEKAQEIADACGVGINDPLHFLTQGVTILKAINVNEMNADDESKIPNSVYATAWASAVSHTGALNE